MLDFLGYILYSGYVNWRRLKPSKKQIALLDKYGFSIPSTRGEASDIIGSGKFITARANYMHKISMMVNHGIFDVDVFDGDDEESWVRGAWGDSDYYGEDY